MNIIIKASKKIARYYRQNIVCEQYPLITPISRYCLLKKNVLGCVFMLHHVFPKDRSLIPTNEDLKVSPEFLDKIIGKYKKLNIDILSLDEIYTRVTSNIFSNRPFVTFTLDDGYLDNFNNALPIFEKYQVPFTIFVSTDFIEKKAILWWDVLENLIMTHNHIRTSDGLDYQCGTYQQRWDTFRYLREIILKLDQNNLKSELQKLFNNYDIDWYNPINDQGMSWEHIKELSSHPLCTIGGHTVSHPSLCKLNLEDARFEIENGRDRLEHIMQRSISYFAYPYGTPNEVGEREINIVKELGFKMAFCAHGGCVTDENRSNLLQLPRVYLHEN